MSEAVSGLSRDLSALRVGRASPELLSGVVVDYLGTLVDIRRVGKVGVLDGQNLVVEVWNRDLVKAVEKAIRTSNLGLDPYVIGQSVKVPVPKMTGERRSELLRVVKEKCEEARVRVRGVRREAIKALTGSEDEKKRAEREIQRMTDLHISEIEALLKKKENELAV